VLYEELISENPSGSDAYNFMGILQFQQGNIDRAQELLRRAIQLQPDEPGPYNNLGNILRTIGNLEGALELYREAARLAPDDPDIADNLSRATAALERTEKAIEDFRDAVAMDPASVDVYKDAARAMYAEGRADDAADIFRHWLKQDPDNPTAQHMLAATTGEAAPARASEEYVKETFDGFADTFDEVVKRLGYDIPAKAVAALQRHWNGEKEIGAILDAGCGTGLCGPLLKPLVGELVGVDLSANMLLKASDRNAYDRLAQADLTAFLRQNPNHFDVIIAADTLIYFGDLAPVIRAASDASTEEGLFIFSLESHGEGDTADFSLTSSGRYSHSEKYVSELAVGSGYAVQELENLVVRTERGKPVGGVLVVLKKLT
jgi:predicted TPR repeat methyltransferase